jgi:hypothetical protein
MTLAKRLEFGTAVAGGGLLARPMASITKWTFVTGSSPSAAYGTARTTPLPKSRPVACAGRADTFGSAGTRLRIGDSKNGLVVHQERRPAALVAAVLPDRWPVGRHRQARRHGPVRRP